MLSHTMNAVHPSSKQFYFRWAQVLKLFCVNKKKFRSRRPNNRSNARNSLSRQIIKNIKSTLFEIHLNPNTCNFKLHGYKNWSFSTMARSILPESTLIQMCHSLYFHLGPSLFNIFSRKHSLLLQYTGNATEKPFKHIHQVR